MFKSSTAITAIANIKTPRPENDFLLNKTLITFNLYSKFKWNNKIN